MTTVRVEDLCFTQESIWVNFNRPHDQERIDVAAELILRGDLSPKAFPPMKVVDFQGRLWSLDNRRLWVFKKAEVPVVTVTLMDYDSHDFRDFRNRFYSLGSTTLRFMSRPDFFPGLRGKCKEIFTEDADPDQLPSSPWSPPTPQVRGGRHLELPTKICKQSIPSAAPRAPKPDRPPKRRSLSPPWASKVEKVYSTKSKHLDYDDLHHHHAPSHFRNRHFDEPSMHRMRDSVVPPPSTKYCFDGPSHPKSKKRPHQTEHRHHSSRTPQETWSPPPNKKHRTPSQEREFKAFSPTAPSRTPLEECSSLPAKKSKASSHVREVFKASSPPPSRRHHEECSLPATKKPRAPSHVRELKASPSAPKPPVPTPRDKPKAPRPAKEARPPSPARRTRSSERNAGGPGNLPSCRTTERNVLSSHGQPSRQNSVDEGPALPSLRKGKHSLKGKEAKSSIYQAADKPPPSAPKRNKTSKVTSNPKNFSYDFHSSRKKPKASKGSKKAVASPSTKTSSTQLPDPVVDVSVPSPASPKPQHASSKKPPEPLRSSSTTAGLSTSTKKSQIMDDNFTFEVLIPPVSAPKSPALTCSAEKNLELPSEIHPSTFSTPVGPDPNGHHLECGMPPTTKTGQEQEAPELVDCAAEGELMSETERKLFKLNKQATPVDPELHPPLTPTPSPSSSSLSAKDQRTLDDIIQLLLKDTKSALQTALPKPKADALQKEPTEAESANELPSQTPIDVVPQTQRQDEPQNVSVPVNVHDSVVDCPVQYDTRGQLFESAMKVLGPMAAPSTAFYGDGDVHRAAANVGVTVTASLEPPKLQASTPVKDVLEPRSESKAGSAGDQQGKQTLSWRNGFVEMARTAKSEVSLRLTKITQANPISGSEVKEVFKPITRGQLKKQKEIERKKEKEKRRALREAEKEKAREAKSLPKEKSASAAKNLTTAIVPYDATRIKKKSSGLKVTLHTGDMAYVKVNGELTESDVEGRRRLHPYLRVLGPFRVTRKCNAHAALLELPDDCYLKPIFTLTVLTTSRSPLNIHLPDKRLSITLEPETVLNKRVARRLRKRKVIHYLVKWKTLPATEATWEPETIFDEHPNLVDEVDSPSFSNPFLLRNWKA